MPTVTALRPARKRGYVEPFVDGEALPPIAESEAAARGLSVGVALDEAAVEDLRAAGALAGALALANQYLAHRPRSGAEVRLRLRRAGHDESVVEVAIERLRAQGLLDDSRFAALWLENRAAFKPRAARALENELRRKGIDRETIADAMAGNEGDETDTAVEAGRQRLRAFATRDERLFRQRMGAFLGRRGFDYETIHAVYAVPVVRAAMKPNIRCSRSHGTSCSPLPERRRRCSRTVGRYCPAR